MTDFKYDVNTLEEMIKRIDQANTKNLSTIDMQSILLLLVNDFSFFNPKIELNKNNLKLYGLKTLIKDQYLIDEYLFVLECSKILEKQRQNGFLKEGTSIANNFYKPGNKIIISFYTKHDGITCKIIKNINKNNYSLMFLMPEQEYNNKLLISSENKSFNNNKKVFKDLTSLKILEDKLCKISQNEDLEIDFFYSHHDTM